MTVDANADTLQAGDLIDVNWRHTVEKATPAEILPLHLIVEKLKEQPMSTEWGNNVVNRPAKWILRLIYTAQN